MALEATGAAFPLDAEEGAPWAFPKISSRFDGGIFEPGQLNRGMALTADWNITHSYKVCDESRSSTTVCSMMFSYDEMHLSRYSVGQRHEGHS